MYSWGRQYVCVNKWKNFHAIKKKLPNGKYKRYSSLEATVWTTLRETPTRSSLHPSSPLSRSWRGWRPGCCSALPQFSTWNASPGLTFRETRCTERGMLDSIAALGIIPLSSATLTDSWVCSNTHLLVFMSLCNSLPLSICGTYEYVLTNRHGKDDAWDGMLTRTQLCASVRL